MKKIITTSAAFISLLAFTPVFLEKSPIAPTTYPTFPIPEYEFEVSTETSSNQQVLLAGYHDRYGNWHWGDGTIEPCYNYSEGYYC